jgi:hypothetical protein
MVLQSIQNALFSAIDTLLFPTKYLANFTLTISTVVTQKEDLSLSRGQTHLTKKLQPLIPSHAPVPAEERP